MPTPRRIFNGLWQYPRWFRAVIAFLILTVIGAIISLLVENVLIRPPTESPTVPASLVFGQANSLTFIASEPLSLANLSLVSDENRTFPAQLNDDFRVLLNGTDLPAGGCLIYLRAGTNPALPRDCNRAEVVVLSLIVEDPFWYDEDHNTMRAIDVIYEDTLLVKTCLPETGRCVINR